MFINIVLFYILLYKFFYVFQSWGLWKLNRHFLLSHSSNLDESSPRRLAVEDAHINVSTPLLVPLGWTAGFISLICEAYVRELYEE